MASGTLHIGLVQYAIDWENPETNMQRLDHLLPDQNVFDLLLLPEMWSTGFTMQPEHVAEQHQGPAFHWMRQQAQKRNTAIGGSISVKDQNHYFNRWYCLFPDGHFVYYDKKHLFSYGHENQHYSGGEKTLVFALKGWQLMPVICYDIRFPAWCRNSTNYDILLVAANWPAPRIHHWDTLLKARAIENQAYVAAVNRIGSDANGLDYTGHSQVIDMNGQELISPDVMEGVKSIVLDKSRLADYREKYPFLRDRDNYSL